MLKNNIDLVYLILHFSYWGYLLKHKDGIMKGVTEQIHNKRALRREIYKQNAKKRENLRALAGRFSELAEKINAKNASNSKNASFNSSQCADRNNSGHSASRDISLFDRFCRKISNIKLHIIKLFSKSE